MIGVVLAHNDHMDGWDWVWGSVMMVLFVVLIGLVVFAVIRGTQHIGGYHPHQRAREILAERLARGEITADEYRELSQHL